MIKCNDFLRSRIFKYTHHLKGVRNQHKDFYFVNQMLPDQLFVEKREVQYTIKKLKQQNKTLPVNEQKKVTIKNKVLHMDGKPQIKFVRPSTVSEILSVDSKGQDRMNAIPMAASDIFKKKKKAVNLLGMLQKLNQWQMHVELTGE